MTTRKLKTITIGELRGELEWLLDLPDSTEVYFGAGDLTFYRAKARGWKDGADRPHLVNIELHEDYTVNSTD